MITDNGYKSIQFEPGTYGYTDSGTPVQLGESPEPPVPPVPPTPTTGDKTYLFEQTTPSSDWTITHNFGKYPSVFMEDMDGNDIDGDIEPIDENSLVIHFSTAVMGYATLN